jgi:hypothetical protein
VVRLKDGGIMRNEHDPPRGLYLGKLYAISACVCKIPGLQHVLSKYENRLAGVFHATLT